MGACALIAGCPNGQSGPIYAEVSEAELAQARAHAAADTSSAAGEGAADSGAARPGGANGGASVMDGNLASAGNTPVDCDEAKYPVCDGFETVAAGQPPNPLR